MNNSRFLSALVFCLFCSLLGGAVLVAESLLITDESDSLYGRGVHAFFDRNYEEAVTILSKAEEMKNNDPRPYYFLGLAYLRQKKTEQADQYFKKAAQLEYSGRPLRDYTVSEALRRIQGEERLRLEKIRSEERTNAQLREQRLREARYGKETAAARDELRQSASPNQRENSLALPQTTESFADNAFGVQPIDPTNTSTESVIVRRTDSSAFGEVTARNIEVLEVPTVIIPRNREPEPTQARRSFVNVDISVEPQEIEGNRTTAVNPVRSVQTTAAREIGRALGALFSRKQEEE